MWGNALIITRGHKAAESRSGRKPAARERLCSRAGVLEFRAHRSPSKGRGTGAGSAVRTSGPLQQFIPGRGPALSAEAGTAGSDNRAAANGQVHQEA